MEIHGEPPKIAPAIIAMNGCLAPQGINVVVMIVIRRSRSFSIVLDAMIPGIPQPVPTSIGMNDLPERTEFSEDTVKHECDTCHITASLKNSKQNEQYEHLRNEAEYSAYTGNNTVKDKTL